MRRSRSSGRSLALSVMLASAAACHPVAAPSEPCSGESALVLSRQADLAAIAHCATLSSLTLRSAGQLDPSALRALTTITGDLTIGPTIDVDEIVLGNLRAVHGAIRIVANTLVKGVFLPRLERAGRVAIDGNASLTTVAMPRLAVINGALRLTDNANLEALDLPALLAIDQELVIAGDPKLALIEASRLRRTGGIAVAASRLPAEVIDRLRTIAAAPQL
jgi:hypothetical protein